jgi:hypothetical protein
VYGLRQMYHRLRNHFGPFNGLSYEAQLEAHFGLFGDSANLDASKVLVLR